ncbi:MAG: hypothetical protein ACRDPD_01825 [Streptosporangiaceae bacterium]
MKGRNLRAADRVGLAVLSAVAAVTVIPAASASAGAWHHQCAPPTAYVANNESGTVTPIRTRTGTAGPAIPVGQDPFVIAITPDGRTSHP